LSGSDTCKGQLQQPAEAAIKLQQPAEAAIKIQQSGIDSKLGNVGTRNI